ncbi:MAG: hypothetical protein HQ521_02480 [Bacteroidetes bacterium]|nr:hypothetical protein [Bacteroidota bacterium]
MIIHIGLHKTGTSFLQEKMFPKIMGINYLHGTSRLRNIYVDKQKSLELLISDEKISGLPFTSRDPDNSSSNYYITFLEQMEIIHKSFNNPKIIIGFRKHYRFVLSLYKQYLAEVVANPFNISSLGMVLVSIK